MPAFFAPRRFLQAWLLLVLGAAAAWGSGWAGSQWQAGFARDAPAVHDALFWKRGCHGTVCNLCPRHCFLPEGVKGWCRTRINAGGRLYTLVYGRPAAIHVDPIEKKPVFHCLPGSRTFSLATAGCNLRCDFCQNWSLSQAHPEDLPADFLSPQQIVDLALHSGCRSVAYTYSEPVVFYEYMADIARLARQAGLYNIMISAGYIEPEPLQRLLPCLDVVKIDLKGFDEHYYHRMIHGDLRVVLRTLKTVQAAGVQLEVVNLVVPGQNDRPEQLLALSRWVREQLGADTPLFFSRFTPAYQLLNLPPTPLEILRQARTTAREAGLNFVYLGNVPGDEGENTYCPQCGRLLVQRIGFAVMQNHISSAGKCPCCGRRIPGLWSLRDRSRKLQRSNGRGARPCAPAGP